jgi:hypothetical protein
VARETRAPIESIVIGLRHALFRPVPARLGVGEELLLLLTLQFIVTWDAFGDCAERDLNIFFDRSERID